MRQGEQGLPGRIEALPSGANLGAVVADRVGEVVQGAGGQRNRGRVGQQRGSRLGALILVDCRPTGASPHARPGPSEPTVSCTIMVEKGSFC